MIKFTLFKNSRSKKPDAILTLEQFLFSIKSGQWQDQVDKVRKKKDSHVYKKLKENLPAVTISGDFKVRDKFLTIDKKLRRHTGLICLDVDKKDNPKMRTKDLIDAECVAQFVSAGGEGIKIIYYCKPVKTEQEHRRIYDAAILRLSKKGIQLKVDPIVKSISSLQYVSYDENLYENLDSNLMIKPLAPIKREKVKPSADKESLVAQLEEYIEALEDRDITKVYEDWLNVMFGISHSLGEAGRPLVHLLCKNYREYSAVECDEKFDSCLEMKQMDNPVTIATVFQLINSTLPKSESKRLAKKFNINHAKAVGVGEEVDSENPDLSGMVRYKLFLFKKLIDRETRKVHDLVPAKLNLNVFESLLRSLGFFRHEKLFIQITNNIVEVVDVPDILRLVTEYVEKEGSYNFTYKGVEYLFSWEEIIYKWREIRALSTTANQIAASVPHWIPNLLKDTPHESFIPYKNAVLQVSAKSIKLMQYKDLTQQIWKERILPRDFKWEKKVGMFQNFFYNVMGRGENKKQILKSAHLNRALWYFGYMLHCNKRQSIARAWILYDVKTGNNGRSGKTIIGSAIGHIRNVTVIDGKQEDFQKNNRFALQKVKPWTDIVFIDDPSKFMSLNPLFNMITGQATTEKKGKDPVEHYLKWLIASNWFLEAGGNSEIGRQFVSQLSDFYIKYAKEHKDTITPIVDVHGKEFFTDWDAKDWAKFDNFCASCLQFYFKNAPPDNTIIGNSAIMRFIQLNEEELFFQLCLTLVKNLIQNGTHSAIPQQALSSVIRESNESLKANKAGKIAREFLAAIGVKDLHMSTMRGARATIMTYAFTGTLKSLDFGHLNKLKTEK